MPHLPDRNQCRKDGIHAPIPPPFLAPPVHEILLLRSTCADIWRHSLGCLRTGIPLQANSSLLGCQDRWPLHGCRRTLLEHEYHWHCTRLGNLDLAYASRREFEVTETAEMGSLGTLWARLPRVCSQYPEADSR